MCGLCLQTGRGPDERTHANLTQIFWLIVFKVGDYILKKILIFFLA